MAVRTMQAHPLMGRRWRDFVEGILPWYNPTAERLRNARTEAIRKRSISARIRSERVIADYEQADSAAHVEHQKLIAEARRDATK